MYIKSKPFIIGYRIVISLLCAAGIILNYFQYSNNVFNLLSYFTILSNIFVLIYIIWALYNTINKGVEFEEKLFIKGAVLLYIMITFLIFFLVLRPTMVDSSDIKYLSSPANALAHYVTPWLFFFDYLLFSRKGLWHKLYPIKWMAFPLIYFAFCIIRAQFLFFDSGLRYPYFFMDFNSQPLSQVLTNVVVMIIEFIVLGYVFYALDYFLGKFTKR
ncbi:MAG: Pr6Pr family membrane protein [Bifidobacteriaceae bacterium]|jgi:hypothetical protein|nr:Pr6Pr family membrane protein [Bifidobacteriaceae bacterium]